MNVALIATCLASPRCPAEPAIISPPASSSRPSLGYMDRAYHDARAHGWSREPVVEMLIPSTLDDTPGAGGPACREPVLPARRAGTAGWTVLGRSSRGGRRPHDRDGGPIRAGLHGKRDRPPGAVAARPRARSSACIGGDIFHGALTLDQLFSARPMLGHADYRGAAEGPLPLRLRRPSRRRRHRRARATMPQRRFSRIGAGGGCAGLAEHVPR